MDSIAIKNHVAYLIIDPETEEPLYVEQRGDFERGQRGYLGKANHYCKHAIANIAQIFDAGMSQH